MVMYSTSALVEAATAYLKQAGACQKMAESTARCLVRAEAIGLRSHGLSRLPQYASHIQVGRVEGNAVPSVVRSHGAGVIVDAGEGLAFPACELAISEAIVRAKTHSISYAGVTRSHHFGAAGIHLEAVARAGLIGLAFTNSPAAIAAWGGAKPLFGTNPIAAVFPRQGADPIVVDLSLSKVARGKLMVAAKDGKKIPAGWALDRDGNETTDPERGLEGTMYPLGGLKGSLLALIVELLCVSLTGAAFGFEADSFFQVEGNRPHMGHAFIVIDPSLLAGSDVYNERVEFLVAAMLSSEGVRLPGAHRFSLARQAAQVGIDVPADLATELLGS